ncbi:MAG: VCBS repeat-containing protein [Phycisphaerales bacterium]|nr:VCBS repeat-containing protein [Phycisphaerales bacterium]
MIQTRLSPRLLIGLVPAFVAGSAMGQQFVQQTASLFAGLPSEYTNQATVVDIDGDGDLDIVLANGQGYSSQGAALKPRILVNKINEVEARFVDETDARAAGVLGWFRGVEAGDCDGDGDWDLVLAQDFNKQPKLLINDGTGVFTDETGSRLPAVTMSSARAQFADVDNDGDLDLFFCNSGTSNRFGSGQPRLFLNDGTGNYTNVTATNIPAGNISDQQDCIFGDVDGDLDLDIHIGSRAGQSKLWLNDGNGVFTNSPFPTGGSSYSYDFGDIDGDGDLDMLSINGGTDRLLQNNMPGAWVNISSEISPNAGIDDNDSKFFDYDNDGDLDYVVASLGSSERVFRNNGPDAPGAQFTQVTGIMPNVGDSSLDIVVADFDGDNRIDVVTLQGESGSFVNKIYMNTTGPEDTIAPTIVLFEQLPDTALPDGPLGPFAVRLVAYDSYSSDRGFYAGPGELHWSLNGGPEQTSELKWHGNSMWRGVIDEVDGPGTVTYYATIADRAGNVATTETLSFDIDGGVQNPCDFDNNGTVDGADLGFLLAEWGQKGSIADLNGDGTVDGADLGLLLACWG